MEGVSLKLHLSTGENSELNSQTCKTESTVGVGGCFHSIYQLLSCYQAIHVFLISEESRLEYFHLV